MIFAGSVRDIEEWKIGMKEEWSDGVMECWNNGKLQTTGEDLKCLRSTGRKASL
jgi:hypothetical protein